MDEHEILKNLEEDYASTKIISVVWQEGQLPKVVWDGLPEAEVIATLFRALLFMTIDDFIYDAMDGFMDEDDEDEDEDGS